MRCRNEGLCEGVLREEWLSELERDIEDLLVEREKETQQGTMPSPTNWETPQQMLKSTPPRSGSLEPGAEQEPRAARVLKLVCNSQATAGERSVIAFI
jgi:hypothetical protein